MIRIVFAVMFLSSSIGLSYAEFFANVGKSAEVKEASASAFEAIGNVYFGLSNLERQGPSGSDEAFKSALEKLSQAIDKFKILSESGESARELDLSQMTDNARLPQYLNFYQMQQPKTVGDLFTSTSAVLSRVYSSIKVFLEKRQLQEYNSMQAEIGWALGFGELASEIAQQNKL